MSRRLRHHRSCSLTTRNVLDLLCLFRRLAINRFSHQRLHFPAAYYYTIVEVLVTTYFRANAADYLSLGFRFYYTSVAAVEYCYSALIFLGAELLPTLLYEFICVSPLLCISLKKPHFFYSFDSRAVSQEPLLLAPFQRRTLCPCLFLILPFDTRLARFALLRAFL